MPLTARRCRSHRAVGSGFAGLGSAGCETALLRLEAGFKGLAASAAEARSVDLNRMLYFAGPSSWPPRRTASGPSDITDSALDVAANWNSCGHRLGFSPGDATLG